jgi:hypothetical protein
LQTAKEKGFKLFIDTRKPAKNILQSSSSSNVPNWFTAGGDPFTILRQVDMPYSSLYWRIYLKLNVTQFKHTGYLLFAIKFIPILVIIVVFTILRYLLPYGLRLNLSKIKHQLDNVI